MSEKRQTRPNRLAQIGAGSDCGCRKLEALKDLTGRNKKTFLA